jgi:hypothetical protein
MLDFDDLEGNTGSVKIEESDDPKEKKSSEDSEEEEEQENILRALLFHMVDSLALMYMGYYYKFLNKDLFLFSLKKNNKMFIQESLLTGAFDKQIFKYEEVVRYMLECMEDGSKTNFLLQTMLLTEVSLWKNSQIEELIGIFERFSGDKYDVNRLLLSYNPLMSITLSAELLTTIAKTRKRFENECEALKESLLYLGKVYNSKIDNEDYFESLIMDTDF